MACSGGGSICIQVKVSIQQCKSTLFQVKVLQSLPQVKVQRDYPKNLKALLIMQKNCPCESYIIVNYFIYYYFELQFFFVIIIKLS